MLQWARERASEREREGGRESETERERARQRKATAHQSGQSCASNRVECVGVPSATHVLDTHVPHTFRTTPLSFPTSQLPKIAARTRICFIFRVSHLRRCLPWRGCKDAGKWSRVLCVCVQGYFVSTHCTIPTGVRESADDEEEEEEAVVVAE